MAADLIAKLKLDSSNWDTQINKSKKSIKKFETDSKQSMVSLDSVTGKLGGTFTKFAGFIGLAVTAGETLNKMLESNQTTSDLFHNNLNAAKDSVDLFFKSLTTGDWSAFNGGILGTFDNLKNLSMMLDELADKKLSLGFIRADDLKDIEKFEQIAKDTNKTLEERKDAASNMQGVINHLNKRTKETADFELNTLNQNYASKSGLKIDTEDLKYFAKNTNFSGTLTTEANNAYKTYIQLNKEAAKLKKQFDYEVKNFGFDPTKKNQKKYLDKKKEAELYKSENEFLIKQGWLTEENEEARQKMIQTLIEQINLEKEIYSLQKRADETIRGVNTSSSKKVSSSTSTKKIEGKEGSLAYLNKELADLNTKLSLATDEATRYGIREAIKKVNREKLMIELEATLGTNKLKGKELKKVQGKIPSDILDEKIYDKAVKSTNSKNKLFEVDNSALDYLTAMGSLMGSFSGLADNAGAAWLQYTANLISSVGAMLPALASLFRITAALGMAEQTKIPFPLNIVAMAATGAGLVAAIASIPKFASGGIIQGGAMVGDKNLIGVNSGEMILNKGQQSRLFNILDGKQSLNNGMNGNVTFKVQGKELIGVLNNYSSKINKY